MGSRLPDTARGEDGAHRSLLAVRRAQAR